MSPLLLVAVSAALLLHLAPVRSSIIEFGSDCGNDKSHNFFYGIRKPFDRLYYADHVKYESKMMRKNSVDLTYPVKGQLPMGPISSIEVIDGRQDGSGGCAYIRNGGIGLNFVTLKLKSQRNHGMEFDIKIYGN